MPHTLDQRIRTSHAVRNIRDRRMPAPQSVARRRAVPVGLPLPPRPAPRPRRDGVPRPAALASLDDHGRVSVRPVLAALGWDEATALVARNRAGTAVITRRSEAAAPGAPVRPIDRAGRLTLPPLLTAALDVGTGEQVLMYADLAAGELRLHAAVDVLQTLATAAPAAATAAG